MATVEQIRRLSVTGTTTGLDKMASDLNKVGAAQENVSQTATKVEAATKRSTGTVINAQAAFDRLSRSIDPVAKAQAELDRATRLGAQAMQQNTAAVEQHQRNIGILQQRLEMARKGSVDHAQAVGLQRYQITNLSFQLNDMATMLASGSSPFQIMATQGGQVFQVLQQGPQGVGGSLKQLGSMLLGILTPARLAMGAVAGIGIAGAAAWNSWDNKIKDAQRSLNQLGRGTGLTTQSLTSIAERAAGGGSVSMTNAMGGASTFAGAGIFGDVIERLLPLSRQYAGATGLSITDSQKELSSIGNPMQALGEFSKRFGPFGFEVEQNVRRLQTLGQLQEAQAAVVAALSARLKDATDTTGIFAKGWEKIGNLGSSIWASMGRVGAEPSLEDQLAALNERSQRRGVFTLNPGRRNELIDEKRESLQEQIRERDRKAAADAAEAQRMREAAIERQNRSITEGGELGARGVLARSASERLAIEQERILKEARLDGAKAATAAAESEKARTMALAEANRALRDYTRNARDEAFMGGALTDVERFRRQTQIEQRDLRERTDVLRDGGAGAGPAVAGAQGLAGEFRTKLEALIAAIPGISITSGFRTNAEQARLYAEKPHLAAPPGRSNHEFGLAADLRFATPEARAEAHRRAGEFGMRFPMGHEPWHIEPVGARAMRGAAAPLTVRGSSDAPGPVDDARVSAFQDNLAKRLFFETEQAAGVAKRQLDATAATFGKSTYEIARQNEQIRLENDLRRAGVEVSAEHAAKIRELAEAEGLLAKRREEVAESQRRQIAAMDELRSSTTDLISSPLKAMARGESGSDALRQVGLRMGDKMIDAGSRGITETLFGKAGKGGGGIFGDLLGGLMGGGGMNAANMNVQAGNVVVTGGAGGLGGAGGGGGILGSLFSSWFGGGGGQDGTPNFARGAAFRAGNVVPFATGGVVSSATSFPMAGGRTGVMGEAGHEGIMPLQRDRSGRLGVIVAERARQSANRPQAVSIRGGDFIIQGNVTEDILPRVKSMIDKAQKQQHRSLQKNFGQYQKVNEEDAV